MKINIRWIKFTQWTKNSKYIKVCLEIRKSNFEGLIHKRNCTNLCFVNLCLIDITASIQPCYLPFSQREQNGLVAANEVHSRRTCTDLSSQQVVENMSHVFLALKTQCISHDFLCNCDFFASGWCILFIYNVCRHKIYNKTAR